MKRIELSGWLEWCPECGEYAPEETLFSCKGNRLLHWEMIE